MVRNKGNAKEYIYIYVGNTRDGCRMLIGKRDGTSNLRDLILDGMIRDKIYSIKSGVIMWTKFI